MDVVIVLVVLAAVVVFISGPLRRDPEPAGSRELDGELADLEAAREAKYREIRDAELDHRTGKLSDEDYTAVDASLRAEAVEIMHALDTIGPR